MARKNTVRRHLTAVHRPSRGSLICTWGPGQCATRIDHMFRYLSPIFRNSLRNRRRSALTMLSIGMSLCLLGVLGALYRGLFLAPPAPGQELRLVTHHKVSITQSLPASYEDKIRQ